MASTGEDSLDIPRDKRSHPDMRGLKSGATLNPDDQLRTHRIMSEPLDNPISEPQAASNRVDLVAMENEASASLPEILRGRMFCVVHGRQCYRAKTFTGELVWVCPDERHSKPLIG